MLNYLTSCSGIAQRYLEVRKAMYLMRTVASFKQNWIVYGKSVKDYLSSTHQQLNKEDFYGQ